MTLLLVQAAWFASGVIISAQCGLFVKKRVNRCISTFSALAFLPHDGVLALHSAFTIFVSIFISLLFNVRGWMENGGVVVRENQLTHFDWACIHSSSQVAKSTDWWLARSWSEVCLHPFFLTRVGRFGLQHHTQQGYIQVGANFELTQAKKRELFYRDKNLYTWNILHRREITLVQDYKLDQRLLEVKKTPIIKILSKWTNYTVRFRRVNDDWHGLFCFDSVAAWFIHSLVRHHCKHYR